MLQHLLLKRLHASQQKDAPTCTAIRCSDTATGTVQHCTSYRALAT
jgi:hypothetical protein